MATTPAEINIDKLIDDYTLTKNDYDKRSEQWWKDATRYYNAEQQVTTEDDATSKKVATKRSGLTGDKGSTIKFLDVDGYYNFYGVMAPRVQVSFLTSNGTFKDINEIAVNKKQQNNYFVNAQIEDTGVRKLTLTLFDRNFYSLQSLIFDSIKAAGGNKKISDPEKIASSDVEGTNVEISFVKSNNLDQIKNNVRVRWGYSDVNETIEKAQNHYPGLGGNWGRKRDFRWFEYQTASVNSKDNELSPEFTYGSADQSTLVTQYEDFFITNVQTTLTNTGIQYTITAVGTDTFALNAYKFVQYYAQITAKPREILAFFMKAFNENSQAPLKIVWDDDIPLLNGDEIGNAIGGVSKTEEEIKDLKRKLEAKQKVNEFYTNTLAILNKNSTNTISEKGFAGKDIHYEIIGENNHNRFDTQKKSYFGCVAPFFKSFKDEDTDKQETFIPSEASDLTGKKNEACQFLYYTSKKWGTIAAKDKIKKPKKNYLQNRYAKLMWAYGVWNTICTFNNPELDEVFATMEVADETDALERFKNFQDKIGKIISEASTLSPGDWETFESWYSENVSSALRQEAIDACDDLMNSGSTVSKFKDYTPYWDNYISTGGLETTFPSNVKDYYRTSISNLLNLQFPTATSAKANPKVLLAKWIKNEDGYYKQLKSVFNNILAPGNVTVGSYFANVENFLRETIGISDYKDYFNDWSGDNAIPQDVHFDYAESSIISGDITRIKNFINCMIPFWIGLSYFHASGDNNSKKYIKLLDLNNQYAIVNPSQNLVAFLISSDTSTDSTFKYYSHDEEPQLIDTGLKLSDFSNNRSGNWYYYSFYVKSFTKDGFGRSPDLSKIIELTNEEYDYKWLNNEYFSRTNNYGQNLASALITFSNVYNAFKDSVETGAEAEIIKWLNENIASKLTGTITIDPDVNSEDFFNSTAKPLWEEVQKACLRSDTALRNLSKEAITNQSEEYENFQQQITTLKQQIASMQSRLSKNKITLVLGGEEAGSPFAKDGNSKKLYKSLTSLFNSFATQCPPYTISSSGARATDEQKSQTISVTDENGDQTDMEVETYNGSYPLTWSLLTRGNAETPVIGFHYKKPKHFNKIRVYSWGTGNPKQHAVKDLSISTSSEFAMLNMAININRDGNSENVSSDGSVKVKSNYPMTKDGAFVNNVVSSDTELKDLANTMINSSVRKGSITVLGDPSLRFAGIVQPYTYPIYINIKLQNDNSWSSENIGTQSQLTGYYTISKITHNISASGYTTTLEVISYPGIKAEL